VTPPASEAVSVILVGLGSETFEQGGHINSFRLAFGTRRGF